VAFGPVLPARMAHKVFRTEVLASRPRLFDIYELSFKASDYNQNYFQSRKFKFELNIHEHSKSPEININIKKKKKKKRRNVNFPTISKVGYSIREGVSWSEELSKVNLLNLDKFLLQSA
jgi:hypothetical protein